MTRYKTGNTMLDEMVTAVLDEVGPVADRDILSDILVSAVRLAGDDADRLDLKITSAALKEMRAAFRAFAPYRDVPKVTIFGSARTLPHDPTYVQAKALAAELASRGWMVVTGAGPGIMAAGLEGAGLDRAFGVTIRLPFEETANKVMVGDERLVSMKYFFTRKLMLIKESKGFVSCPGGFGTQDETFELLTLQQTGKSDPAPIVLLDEPGGTYWTEWARFVDEQLAGKGLIDADDHLFYTVTDDVPAAVEEITGFYRNYHSLRWVGNRLIVRLHHAPSDERLAELNGQFADVCSAGQIERTQPMPPEVTDNDHLELDRLALQFNPFKHARFRALLAALNQRD